MFHVGNKGGESENHVIGFLLEVLALFGPVLMLAGFEALWRLYQMIA